MTFDQNQSKLYLFSHLHLDENNREIQTQINKKIGKIYHSILIYKQTHYENMTFRNKNRQCIRKHTTFPYLVSITWTHPRNKWN